MLKLFDYVTDKGDNDILLWMSRLQKPDRARLDQKLTRLAQIDFKLAWRTHLLAGPVHESIWKLRVNASVMLRPHLCKGPVDNNAEYTLLIGAVEIGGRLPRNVERDASDRRVQVKANPVSHRTPHGRASTNGVSV